MKEEKDQIVCREERSLVNKSDYDNVSNKNNKLSSFYKGLKIKSLRIQSQHSKKSNIQMARLSVH
jgi:hypothetical protein